jgi:hypothetical protein
MSEFVFLYRSGDREYREAMGSPEKAQQNMQKWRVWMKDLADKGHIKSPGQPLERTGKVVKGVQKIVTDGPYAESKDIIGGYTLIEAKDIAHAAELSRGCPILDGGGMVEVRPVMKMDL